MSAKISPRGLWQQHRRFLGGTSGDFGIIPMVLGLGRAFCSLLPTLPPRESRVSNLQPLWVLLLKEFLNLEQFLNLEEFLNLEGFLKLA